MDRKLVRTKGHTRGPAGSPEADLSTKSEIQSPSSTQDGDSEQAARAFSSASTLLSGILAIALAQVIGMPLKLVDPKSYQGYVAWTKESFIILMTAITQWWAPTIVRVSGDDSMRGQLFQMADGSLKCNFPHRLVLMSNHQLYTDWLYLWWIAYSNNTHGSIYIVLKESLKQLPLIGWGMQFYNFIFLSRKWDTDKDRFKSHLDRLKRPTDPMWLVIFPEGTNLCAVTRENSAAWSRKSGIPDMKHQLLPRTTGLQFCLKELRSSTNWLYDATVAYEGAPAGVFAQDVFTLKGSFLDGQPPKSVNIFWRRFKISEIPLDNPQAFARWLVNRWREKDYMLEYFHMFGHFPAADPLKAISDARRIGSHRHAKFISASVQGRGWNEFFSIFDPITTTAGALSTVDMTEPFKIEQLLSNIVGPHLAGTAAKAQKEKLLKSCSATQTSAAERKKIQRRSKLAGQNEGATTHSQSNLGTSATPKTAESLKCDQVPPNPPPSRRFRPPKTRETSSLSLSGKG